MLSSGFEFAQGNAVENKKSRIIFTLIQIFQPLTNLKFWKHK